MPEEQIKEIRKLIVKAKVKKALELLNELALGRSCENEAASLLLRYNTTQREIHTGIITQEAASVKEQKIVRALFRLLDEINTPSEIKSIGGYFQYSCDRKEIKRKFERKCEILEENGQKYHSFIICEQQRSRAKNLVRRLKIELERAHKEVGPKVSIEQANHELITITVDKKSDVDDLIFETRRDFNKVYGIKNNVKSINELLENIDNIKGYQHCDYLAFDINLVFDVEEWTSQVIPTLEWLFDKFIKHNKNSKQIILFFILLSPRYEKVKEKKGLFSFLSKKKTADKFDLQATIKESALIKGNTTLLPELTTLVESDIEDWFRELNHPDYTPQDEAQKLAQKLGAPPWDMADVEQELKMIINQHRNKANGI